MKKFKVIVLLFLYACKDITPIPPKAPPTSGYHLEQIVVMGGQQDFQLEEKVLSFDSARKTVEITGTSKIFHANGTYNYRLFDSILTRYVPTTKTYVQSTAHLIQLGNLRGDLIYTWQFDSATLLIYADYSYGMADEEQWFHFTKK